MAEIQTLGYKSSWAETTGKTKTEIRAAPNRFLEILVVMR
jgi:hypothetical protein